jgi:hypothetical protein
MAAHLTSPAPDSLESLVRCSADPSIVEDVVRGRSAC